MPLHAPLFVLPYRPRRAAAVLDARCETPCQFWAAVCPRRAKSFRSRCCRSTFCCIAPLFLSFLVRAGRLRFAACGLCRRRAAARTARRSACPRRRPCSTAACRISTWCWHHIVHICCLCSPHCAEARAASASRTLAARVARAARRLRACDAPVDPRTPIAPHVSICCYNIGAPAICTTRAQRAASPVARAFACLSARVCCSRLPNRAAVTPSHSLRPVHLLHSLL